MSTLYEFDSTQWPVLQSSTEVKHKSGLLSASAQFICPANNIVIPSRIPSSEGEIDNIYPPPSVSIQNGWATINATGYKKWGQNAEIIKNIVLIDLYAYAQVNFYNSEKLYEQKIKTTGESATVKELSSDLPEMPELKLFGKQTWKIQEVMEGISPAFFTGNFNDVSPTLTTEIMSVRSTNFGSLNEIETTYELKAVIYFGVYSTADTPTIAAPPQ